MIELSGILVSELSDVGTIDGEELCAESLFLVSQKTDQNYVSSGFISRKLQYKQLLKKINLDCGITDISGNLNKVTEVLETSSVLSCKTQYPYILSSYTFKGGGLISAEGYRLRDGMTQEFNTYKFPKIMVSELIVDRQTMGSQMFSNPQQTTESTVEGVKCNLSCVTLKFYTKENPKTEIPFNFVLSVNN